MNEGAPISANANVSLPASQKPIAEWIFAGIVLLIQALSFGASPGYMRPFLNTTVGQVVMSLGLIWQMLGLALICVPRSPVLSWPAIARWIVIPLFFVVPFFLVMILGPALLTIVNAIGPVMDTK